MNDFCNMQANPVKCIIVCHLITRTEGNFKNPTTLCIQRTPWKTTRQILKTNQCPATSISSESFSLISKRLNQDHTKYIKITNSFISQKVFPIWSFFPSKMCSSHLTYFNFLNSIFSEQKKKMKKRWEWFQQAGRSRDYLINFGTRGANYLFLENTATKFDFRIDSSVAREKENSQLKTSIEAKRACQLRLCNGHKRYVWYVNKMKNKKGKAYLKWKYEGEIVSAQMLLQQNEKERCVLTLRLEKFERKMLN